MFNVIGFMFAGVGIGYLFRRVSLLHKTEKTMSITIFIMLFILGVSVGSNPLIMNNLGQFGWQAAILASAGLTGSVLAAWLVYLLFFKKGDKQ